MQNRLLSVPISIILSRLGNRRPIRVMHFSTFRCNLHCTYCGIWKTPKKEMDTEQVKKAMREFADAGTIFWTFTGGESLVRKDIGELVDYAKGLFPIVTLTTNGLLLKKRINEVKNANYFTLSIDGTREVTDHFRGKGTYAKALEGIKAARDMGIDVILNAVISKSNTKNNFEGIKKLLSLIQELNCKINFSAIYSDQFNKSTINECLVTPNEQSKALDIIKEYKKQNPDSIMFSDPCIDRLKELKKWKKCYAGRLFCDLFPDGTVVPCLFKENNGINGLKHGFANAFNMLPENKNCSCPSTCYNELNCIFSLRPRSVVQNFMKYITFIG